MSKTIPIGRRPHFAALGVLLLTTVLAGAAAPMPGYLQPGDVDVQAVLSGPPANDSPEHRAELAEMLHEQNRRTAEQIARCRWDAHLGPELFADVLGDDFTVRRYPLTFAMLKRVRADTDRINAEAKQKWLRPRPYVEDARIHPCIHLEPSTSYPSGHSSAAEVYGRVLSEEFPDKRRALLDRAKQIATDRTLAGVHFPSDVTAGMKLGDALADKLLDSGEFRAMLNDARSEVVP